MSGSVARVEGILFPDWDKRPHRFVGTARQTAALFEYPELQKLSSTHKAQL
jgi:hypothetical protein